MVVVIVVVAVTVVVMELLMLLLGGDYACNRALTRFEFLIGNSET